MGLNLQSIQKIYRGSLRPKSLKYLCVSSKLTEFIEVGAKLEGCSKDEPTESLSAILVQRKLENDCVGEMLDSRREELSLWAFVVRKESMRPQ